MAYVWVGLGGAVGAVARYATTVALASWLGGAFPWGTLVVNVVAVTALRGEATEAAHLRWDRARLEGRLYEAGARALHDAFGRDVIYAGEGGSIPIVSEFERVLGAPALLMGFGLPGENAHAPDEWMSVENFEKGTHASARLLEELAS